ncbi:hypothetical protein ES703_10012 [subsurface metagenome]
MDPIEELLSKLYIDWIKGGGSEKGRAVLSILRMARDVNNPDPVSQIYHAHMTVTRTLMDVMEELRHGKGNANNDR